MYLCVCVWGFISSSKGPNKGLLINGAVNLLKPSGGRIRRLAPTTANEQWHVGGGTRHQENGELMMKSPSGGEGSHGGGKLGGGGAL